MIEEIFLNPLFEINAKSFGVSFLYFEVWGYRGVVGFLGA